MRTLPEGIHNNNALSRETQGAAVPDTKDATEQAKDEKEQS